MPSCIALRQHGSRPSSYPLLVGIADLMDLGVGCAGGEVLQAATSLVERELTQRDLKAVDELCLRLRAGLYKGAGSLDPSVSASDALLAHALAGRLDGAFADRLKLSWFRSSLSDEPRWRGTLRRTRMALFPGQAHLRGGRDSPEGSGPIRLRVAHLFRVVNVGMRVLRAFLSRGWE